VPVLGRQMQARFSIVISLIPINILESA